MARPKTGDARPLTEQEMAIVRAARNEQARRYRQQNAERVRACRLRAEYRRALEAIARGELDAPAMPAAMPEAPAGNA